MRVWGEINRKMERLNYIFLSKIHSKFTKLSYNKNGKNAKTEPTQNCEKTEPTPNYQIDKKGAI